MEGKVVVRGSRLWAVRKSLKRILNKLLVPFKAHSLNTQIFPISSRRLFEDPDHSPISKTRLYGTKRKARSRVISEGT